MKMLTKITAALVLVALCAEVSDARCGGGAGLFGRLRARRAARQESRQAASSQQFAFAPASFGAFAAGPCQCVGCPGNTQATDAQAVPMAAPVVQWTMPTRATSSGCYTVNGQTFCPARR